MIRMTTAAVLALSSTALAQYEITIEIENPVLRPGESTLVTMYAGFEPAKWAIALATGDLLSSVGSTGFSDAKILLAVTSPPGVVTPGEPTTRGFEGIIFTQLNFHETRADPTNPIAYWQATYTAPLDLSEPLDIDLNTMTSRYEVYPDRGRATSESYLPDLVEGSATIHVIPAPASALALACGLLATRRRR